MKKQAQVTSTTGGQPEITAAATHSGGFYRVKQRETLAEVPGLRVRILALLEGQKVPWHYHNHISDTFFCIRGPMRIRTRAPDASHTLYAGDTFVVAPGTAHSVESVGAGECRFMIVQGVGRYDYVPLPD